MIGPMIGTAAMIYSKRTSPRWLRQAIGGIDHQLAALCRQHWRRAREAAQAAVTGTLPVAALEAARIDPPPR